MKVDTIRYENANSNGGKDRGNLVFLALQVVNVHEEFLLISWCYDSVERAFKLSKGTLADVGSMPGLPPYHVMIFKSYRTLKHGRHGRGKPQKPHT